MNYLDLMKFWFESSDNDYETMNVLYQNRKNTQCLFIRHLVIEKLLKGLYAKSNFENPIPPKTHNLILLAKKSNLNIPKEIREKIQVINTFNISARYDDYKRSFDNKCTDNYTEMQVRNIEEVREWLKKQ